MVVTEIDLRGSQGAEKESGFAPSHSTRLDVQERATKPVRIPTLDSHASLHCLTGAGSNRISQCLGGCPGGRGRRLSGPLARDPLLNTLPV